MRENEGFWAMTAAETMQVLGSDPRQGLSQQEAQKLLDRFGPNRLSRERSITFRGVFKEEVMEPMILLLLIVGIVYSIWGEARDAITIFVIIAALVFAEIFTEYRAKKAVAALRKLSPATVPVIRDGLYRQVPTAEIVRGDVLALEVGEKVPADARVVESFGLQVDESALTGEAVPVAKEDRALAAEAPLAERSNMVFAGTTITLGRGSAVVTATGMGTELGKITGLVIEAKPPKTPLQLAMKQLAGLLVWIAVFFSVVIPLIGLLQGKPFKDMVLTGLSLSFATIPEELPIVITMVLGVGALALSRKNVLIRRLRAAETLGGVTVIVTDKTGTLTENRMAVARLATGSGTKPMNDGKLSAADLFLLKIGVLTSNVKKSVTGNYIGDPTEIALVEAANSAGVSGGDLAGEYRLVREFSFDNQRKLMSATFRSADGGFVFAKGAPEALLARSARVFRAEGEQAKSAMEEEQFRDRVEAMAADAMRVIAFAYKRVPDVSGLVQEQAESGLVFVGLAGLNDPPRPGVREAIAAIGAAGVRTVVVSGDHPLTVEKVANQVGIPDHGNLLTGAEMAGLDEAGLKSAVKRVSLFARTTAEQKLQIVKILRGQGQVVAVTGDGINDAPALKSADIGVAMGETGTEVAREAADMLLTDDSFISIATGIKEGRKIFDNLKKGITYYLSVKVALVLTFVVALVLGIPFPFAPVQIILLELFMDLAASATFVAEPMEPDVMSRPPRDPKEKFINRRMLLNITTGSLSLAAAVVINYLLAYYAGWGQVAAQTVAFGTWLIGHIFLALTMRSEREPLWALGFLSNKVMTVWGLGAVVFLIVVTTVPVLQEVVKVTSLDARAWLMAAVIPFITIFWIEIKKAAGRLGSR